MARDRSDTPVECIARDNCPAALACAPSGMPLCEGIARRHAAKLSLCVRLEEIADSLPSAVDRHACLAVTAELLPVLREAQLFEEEVVFPVFAGIAGRNDTLRRLRAEHVEDEAAAEELTETLLRIGHGAEVTNPEALGFMARAFFEGVRRHIAFEREHVMPIVLTTNGKS